ncbi:MAG: DUF302 domain-containing protein [Gammaproteobacteria bacterium]|nr:DUF302 domain-containing protein [Gammaproteobacteria bacterium]
MNQYDKPHLMIHLILFVLTGFFSSPVFSATVLEAEPGLIMDVAAPNALPKTVHQREVSGPVGEVYNKLFTALENNAYFVINEPDIGKTLARFSQRWGKDYNKNEIQSYRSLVFCNAWYANEITNADPSMALICPQHITVIQIQNKTRLLYALPGVVAQNSPAASIIKAMEDEIVKIIDESAR